MTSEQMTETIIKQADMIADLYTKLEVEKKEHNDLNKLLLFCSKENTALENRIKALLEKYGAEDEA